jgi:hypothetical protein
MTSRTDKMPAGNNRAAKFESVQENEAVRR